MANDVFPRLPVLEAVARAAKPCLWRALPDTMLVCCQHLLETTGSLFECLFHNGLRPECTFIMGKVYSTNVGVANALREMGCHVIDGSVAETRGMHGAAIERDAAETWQQVETMLQGTEAHRIVVLDDGGYLGRIPAGIINKYREARKIVGVEQTTSGMLQWNTQYPVINVASSATKRHFEPLFVCKSVWGRVRRYCGAPGAKAGIVGLGKIGAALTGLLRKEGFVVSGYDIDRSRLRNLKPEQRRNSVSGLIQEADVVFGCTGHDSVPIDAFVNATGSKTFASCSSSDIEFRSLLLDPRISWRALSEGYDACPTLEAYDHDRKLSIRILRGGYPVNFDNTLESIPRDDVQLTRGLLLGAVLQSVDLTTRTPEYQRETIMLDPTVQQVVVDAWHSATGRGRHTDRAWYQQESRGRVVPCHAWRR